MKECSKKHSFETAELTAAQESYLRCLEKKDPKRYRRIQGKCPWNLKRSVIPETAVVRTSPVSQDAARKSLLVAQIRATLGEIDQLLKA